MSDQAARLVSPLAPVLQRLTQPEQFKRCMQAPVVSKTQHFALHCQRSTEPSVAAIAVGCVLPKRLAKRAVTRNLLRRLIYASVGDWQKTASAAATVVVRLKSPISVNTYPSGSSSMLRLHMREELRQLFEHTTILGTMQGKAP